MSQAPGVGIECIQPDAKFYEGIRAGTIDLACFAFPIDTTDMVIKTICPLDLVVVSRRNHPAIEKPLDLETFRKLTQIAIGRDMRGLTNIDKHLFANGRRRQISYMAAKVWSMPAMIERTDLIGMLPRRFVQEISGNFALDVHEMPTEVPEQFMYMMWHANSEHDPGHLWLRKIDDAGRSIQSVKKSCAASVLLLYLRTFLEVSLAAGLLVTFPCGIRACSLSFLASTSRSVFLPLTSRSENSCGSIDDIRRVSGEGFHQRRQRRRTKRKVTRRFLILRPKQRPPSARSARPANPDRSSADCRLSPGRFRKGRSHSRIAVRRAKRHDLLLGLAVLADDIDVFAELARSQRRPAAPSARRARLAICSADADILAGKQGELCIGDRRARRDRSGRAVDRSCR